MTDTTVFKAGSVACVGCRNANLVPEAVAAVQAFRGDAVQQAPQQGHTR